MFAKIKGLIYFILYKCFASEKIENVYSTILKLSSKNVANTSSLFVMMVGFSLSGKTTYVLDKFSDYAQIHTQQIHKHLNRAFAILRDDMTIQGNGYWLRQFLSRYIRKRVLKKLLENNVSIVDDACNLKRTVRRKKLSLAKKTAITVQSSTSIRLKTFYYKDFTQQTKN